MPTHNSHTHCQVAQANTQAKTWQRVCLSQRTADRQLDDRKEGRTANTGLAKVAVQCSADTFVVNQSLVLRINTCGENRHLRQARKRCVQL
jgi:capsular polysaccharide biosynthesis protein